MISGFSLGVGASLLFFTLLFLNNSLTPPKFQAFLQGFHTGAPNSSFSPWPFSFSTNPSLSSSSASNASVSSPQRIEGGSGVVGQIREANVSGNIHMGNYTENYASLHSQEQRVQQEDAREANSTLVSEKAKLLDSGNTSQIVKNLNLIGEDRRSNPEPVPPTNSSFRVENNNVGNVSYNAKPDNVSIIDQDSQVGNTKMNFYENCNIFNGKWVRDASKPYYPMGSCPHIDRDFNCHLNGRPDGEYMKWKWQPNECDIPRYGFLSIIHQE